MMTTQIDTTSKGVPFADVGHARAIRSTPPWTEPHREC